MDERRDTPPRPETRAPLVAAATRLSPVQQAWAGYAEHFVACGHCRDVDQRCEDAERLYRAFQEVADAAFERLNSGTARRAG